MSARVLFACWPFEGHVFPHISVATAVREAGGSVGFYSGDRARDAIASQGFELVGFDRVEGAWLRVHEREQTVGGRRQSLRVQREAFRDWLVESIPGQVADLRHVIDRFEPDVIVSDASMWGPPLVLHEADDRFTPEAEAIHRDAGGVYAEDG